MECTHAFWLKYLSSTEISLYEIFIPCPQDPPRVDALPALPEVHWEHTDQVMLCFLVPENPHRWLKGSLLLSCSICHGNNLHSLAVALFVAEHRDQLCCLWHSAEQVPVTLKLNGRECIGHFTKNFILKGCKPISSLAFKKIKLFSLEANQHYRL